MCNCALVSFSSPVKPKHGKLAGYHLRASYADDQHYRTVCENFMLTNSICDFLDSKNAMLLHWLGLAYFSCILYKLLAYFSYILYKSIRQNKLTVRSIL